LSKVDPLTSINASYTGISKLNAHLQIIEDAFENTLSRDGSAPNQMEADIDLNDNQIINTGDPTLGHHVATKDYVDDIAFGNVTVHRSIHRFTATGGQTVFNLPTTYTLGGLALSVFVNGLRLEQGVSQDYVETDSDTITFNSGLSAGDLVVVDIVEITIAP